MVSTNTLSQGESNQHQGFLSLNPTRPILVQEFSLSEKNAFRAMWKKVLILAWIVFSLMLLNLRLQAQCSAACVNFTEIAVDPITGITVLSPAMFYNGDPSACATLTLNPAMVNCSQVGSQVIVTLTAVSPNGSTSTCQDTFLVIDSSPPTITCPANVTLNCGASTLPANTGTATAIDNCDWQTAVTITYSDALVGAPGDCYQILRTWRAQDGSGNASTCVQTITIQDTNFPVLDFDPMTAGNQTTPPVDISLECDDPLPTPPMVTATDGCDLSPTLTLIDNPVGRSGDPFSCTYYEYTIHRTWTATDNCNHSTTAVQHISLEDLTAPAFSASTTHLQIPALPTCDAVVTLDLSGSVSDNCAGVAYLAKSFAVRNRVSQAIVRSGSGLDASGTYLAGDYDFLFFATDPCGNTATFTRRVTIIDNVAPTVSCDPFVVTLTIQPSGNTPISPDLLDNGSFDNCTPPNQLVRYTNPAFLSCSNLSSLPILPIPVWLIVVDANGNKDSCVTLVRPVPAPPAAFCDPITVYLDAMGSYTLTAANLDSIGKQSVYCGFPLTFSASPNTFDCSDLGANPVTLTVTTPFLTSATCQTTVTVRDTLPPVPTCTPFTGILNQSGQVSLEGGWLLSGTHELFMKTGSNGSGTQGFTYYGAASTGSQTVTFDWEYESNDASAADDRFGYRINGGAVTWLTSTSGLSQTGSASISLGAGDALQLVAWTSNNNPTPARFHAYNFSPGFTGDFYPANWTRTHSNSNGVAFIAGSSIGDFASSADNCTSPWEMGIGVSPSSLNCSNLGANTVIVSLTDQSGNIGRCTTTVNVVDGIAPVLQCADFVAQLNSGTAFGGATITVEPGWLMAGPRKIFMESSMLGYNAGSGNTDYTMRVRTPATVTFNWQIVSTDTTAAQEQFGYLRNGVFTQLNSSPSQSGSASVTLLNGQIFGFRLRSDNDLRKARVYLSNFNINFTGDFDPANWTRTLTNSNGRVFIYGSVADNCTDIGDLALTIRRDAIPGPYSSTLTFNCGSPSPQAIRVRAIDQSGNVSTCVSSVSILDNEPPTAGCMASYSVTLNPDGIYNVENAANILRIQSFSFDNCTPSSALDVSAEPDTLTCANIGPNTVVFSVTDLTGNTSTCTTVITIQENNPPSIICPANITVSCTQGTAPAVTGTATATDNCSAVTVTYTDATVSGNAPNCYIFDRTWKATDTYGNMSTCVQRITVVDNSAPVINNTAAQDNATLQCSPTPRVDPTFTDNCSAKLRVDTVDSRIDYGVMPPAFKFTPASCNYYNYTITRTWTAQDDCGNQDSHVQVLTIQDTQAPVFSLPTNLTVNNDPGTCRATVNLQVTANNISDCAAFQYLTITNNSIRGNGAANASGFYNVGTHVVTFTATDPCGNSSSHTVTIVVKDVETPTAICRQGVIVTLNSNGLGPLPVSAINNNSTDNCGVQSLTVSPNLFNCSHIGQQQVVLTMTDPSGNIARCTTSVTVVDGSNVAIACPSDITIACTQNINDFTVTGYPNVTSACGNAAVSHTDVTISGAGNCRVVRRTWTVTNGSSSQSCSHLITVVDNVVPTLPAAPADTTVNCHSIPAGVSLSANDNCKGVFSVSPVETILGRSADPLNCDYYNYQIQRTWTANDDCGNTASRSQLLTVQDTTRPAFNFPISVVIPTAVNRCDTNITVNLANYIADNCAAFAHLDLTVNGNPGNGIISGTYARGIYKFAITAEDPCDNMRADTLTIVIADQQTPDAVCIQNIVIVLDNTGNANITADDVDGGSSDNCTAVPQLLRTVSPNTFTTADIGLVLITMTVTDQSGNSNSCVTYGTVVGGTVYRGGQVLATPGSMANVPVTINNFNDVTSFQVDVAVDRPTVATAASIQNVSPAVSSGGILVAAPITNGFRVSWIDTSSVNPGLTLPDGTSLFELRTNIVGAVGDTTLIKVTNTETAQLIGGIPTMITSTGVDGLIRVISNVTQYTLSGSVRTEPGFVVPVGMASVNLTGTTSASAVTGGSGTFSFTVPVGASATITPSKNINWANGITVYDAFLALLHASGTSLLPTPYKIVAADANANGAVTAFDASLIHQLSIGFISGFPGNTSWRFVTEVPALPANPFASPLNTSFTQNPVTANLTNVNFVGIKSGDLNNSANPLARPAGPTGAHGYSLEFAIDDQLILPGQLVAVPLKARDFRDIVSFQFTMQYDQNLLDLVDIVPGMLPNFTSGNFNTAKASDGQIATGWYNLQPVSLDPETTLFTLYFKSRKAPVHLHNVLSASEVFIPMEVAYSDGELLGQVNLVFETTTDVPTVEGLPFALGQNVPNPFTDETIIGFTLPEAGQASLTISDLAGRVIFSSTSQYTAGYHEIKVRKQDLNGAGLLFYRLETDKHAAVRKMILTDR